MINKKHMYVYKQMNHTVLFQQRSNTLYISGKLAICNSVPSSKNFFGGWNDFRKDGYNTCSKHQVQLLSEEVSFKKKYNFKL